VHGTRGGFMKKEGDLHDHASELRFFRRPPWRGGPDAGQNAPSGSMTACWRPSVNAPPARAPGYQTLINNALKSLADEKSAPVTVSELRLAVKSKANKRSSWRNWASEIFERR
jgi:hypothetical protein